MRQERIICLHERLFWSPGGGRRPYDSSGSDIGADGVKVENFCHIVIDTSLV